LLEKIKTQPDPFNNRVYFERSLISILSNALSRWEGVGVRVKKSKIVTAPSIFFRR
jgi:hypothetical protein